MTLFTSQSAAAFYDKLFCSLDFTLPRAATGRRMEFAIMRGLGASQKRMFASFFLEQALLCLTGCLIGCAGLLFLSGDSVKWLAVLAFLLCYLIGCALSVQTVGRTNLMALLSERE